MRFEEEKREETQNSLFTRKCTRAKWERMQAKLKKLWDLHYFGQSWPFSELGLGKPYVCLHVHSIVPSVVRGQPEGIVSLFPPCGLRNRTLVISLDHKCIYLLNHLHGPWCIFMIIFSSFLCILKENNIS